jgi:uncharacterized protein YxjI
MSTTHGFSSLIYPTFFEGNHFFIDEKVGLLKFSNQYKVYNEEGLQLGLIAQRVSGWHKFLRLVGNFKAMMPFTLEILDMDGNLQAIIKRNWTFWMSKIQILDAEQQLIGLIRQKFRFFRPTFRILDTAEQEIATITGDWKAWNFRITQGDKDGPQIGTITKKWNGVVKEFFTTADKYVVSIEEQVAEDRNKIAIVATAITIDMVLKEARGR